MRRRSSRALPALTDDAIAPPTGRAAFAVTIPLKTITPIVGGGVEPGEPDAVDPVRLPSVRGMLRWWWRALFHGSEESAATLFNREIALWGGVSDDEAVGSRKSRVRPSIVVRHEGELVRGHHRRGATGSLSPVPDWSPLDQRLAYALFPLQLSKDERAQHRGAASAPTNELRRNVRFDLQVEVWPQQPGSQEASGVTRDIERDVEEVLLAVLAWVHFGGIGARTRRGFGALAFDGEVDLHGTVPGKVRSLHRQGVAELWKQLQAASRPGSRLRGAMALAGDSQASAERAQADEVATLQEFRQAIGTARARSSRPEASPRQPGHSHWPEPTALRQLAGSGAEWLQSSPASDRCFPRAAFGLPIEVKFKDRVDERADASVRSEQTTRWCSPVLLRPVSVSDRSYQPVLLLLRGEQPAAVSVHMSNGRHRLPVKGVGPAKDVIRDYLQRADGDAAEAYFLWLREKHRFRQLGNATAGRGSS